MYLQVTIDPECFAEYHYYGLLKTSFGFDSARYLIIDKKTWCVEAIKVAKDSPHLQEVKRKSIINFLNQLSRKNKFKISLSPKCKMPFQSSNWLEWQEYAQCQSKFDLTISERLINGVTYEELIDDFNCWKLKPSIQVKRESDEIISALLPLIKLDNYITIIDPYFKLSPQNKVLVSLIQAMAKHHEFITITIVTTTKAANAKDSFNQIKKLLNLNNFSVRFILIPEKSLHDRYIINQFGAVKAGHGFEEATSKGAQTDNLSLSYCSENEAKNTLEWIDNYLEKGNANETKF